jgi:hypothetical protein
MLINAATHFFLATITMTRKNKNKKERKGV